MLELEALTDGPEPAFLPSRDHGELPALGRQRRHQPSRVAVRAVDHPAHCATSVLGATGRHPTGCPFWLSLFPLRVSVVGEHRPGTNRKTSPGRLLGDPGLWWSRHANPWKSG